MANWYVSSAAWTAVAAWAASTAYTVGTIIRQNATPGIGAERCFRCTTAGTSGTTEPTWSVSKGATTTSGGAVFTEITGQEAYQSAGNWAAPFARIFSANSYVAAGDRIFVSQDHAESQSSSSINIAPTTSPTAPTSIVCVDRTSSGSVPPTAANVTSGASVTISGGGGITVDGVLGDVIGISFVLNGGTASPNLNLCPGYAASGRFRNCGLTLQGSNSSQLLLGGTNYCAGIVFDNVTVTFSATGQYIRCYTLLTWRNSPTPFAGTLPTGGVFNLTVPHVLFEAVDFTALGTLPLFTCYLVPGRAVLRGCKTPTGFVPVLFQANSNAPYSGMADLVGCDSGGLLLRNERWRVQGILTTDTAAVRTGGAADGGTAVAHRITASGQANWQMPFEGLPIAVWNAVAGSAVTITVEGLTNHFAFPANDEFWLSVTFPGTAGSTLATVTENTKATLLSSSTAYGTSSAAWDSAAPARANSTAYAVGQVMKVASNPGKLFICYTAGTTAASEPAGYASAIDGGATTDSSAVFRTGVRFKVSLTVTPQAAGLITVTPKVGRASLIYWVDPVLTLS